MKKVQHFAIASALGVCLLAPAATFGAQQSDDKMDKMSGDKMEDTKMSKGKMAKHKKHKKMKSTSTDSMMGGQK